jgi:hypothetical protein
MKRPKEIRASPKEWIEVLRSAYPFLLNHGVGNPLLFGSQAMSFYMKNPLRSKDLDLVTDQLGPKLLDELTKFLSETRPADSEVRTSTVQTRPFDGRIMRTYSVEMRIRNRPFILEIFDAVLDGQPPSILSECIQTGRKWGLNVWVPSRDALVALRLCFRQPEGISRLNAIRLNRFIQNNRAKINGRKIGDMIVSWGKADLVRKNLEQLKKLHKQEIFGQKQVLRAIEIAEAED